ncbi:hypothetical protein [Spirillospora sp. NPDC029432]|uniref:hypothetical protein n=1 Tax=Spirillospora sp. NPDC029432 TaxID=3154599 RepID=UPI003453D49B
MRPMRARLAVAALVPVLALATACGDDGGGQGDEAPSAQPPVSATSSGTRAAPSPALKSGGGDRSAPPTTRPTKVYNAFARCMRQHGVDVPDAGTGRTPPPEQDPVKAQRALKACAKLLASASPGSR